LLITAGKSINNNGWIIVDGRYLLTPLPLPEPTSIALLAVGLIGLAFIRRRKQ
jgi:PEP-CTERM motif